MPWRMPRSEGAQHKETAMQKRQNTSPERAKSLPATLDAKGGLGEALSLDSASLHELDYEDVALSLHALRLVRSTAVKVLRRFCAVGENELSLSRSLALFLDKVLWDEDSGGLILCAEFPGQRFCLPIPCGEWGLKQRSGPLQ